jgi:hypothetical protein
MSMLGISGDIGLQINLECFRKGFGRLTPREFISSKIMHFTRDIPGYSRIFQPSGKLEMLTYRESPVDHDRQDFIPTFPTGIF